MFSTLCWSRRFVVLIVALLPLSSTISAQTPKPWPPEAKDLKLHMIGNGHIDPVWLWPWSEGLSVVHSTFRSALDRMKEDREFCFTASSAQFYEWIAENDPTMLAEIRDRISEGRWGLVGGWWIEPDVNIPNGESLARQGLYSQRLFQELFGRKAKVAYNPDSFGHTGTLPQILRLEEMENYVFMRPQAHEKNLPADVFWWEGLDGSRVLTFHIPYSYNDEQSVEHGIRRYAATLREPVQSLMYFYGVGDHGGGPTTINLASIHKVQSEPGAPRLLFSTPDTYFAEIRGLPHLQLPVVRGDLQHHAVGCYTAVSEIKKDNRTAEQFLATGEELAALGAVLFDAPYPRAEFAAAWKKVLFMQFHDSMAGSSIPEHYVAARDAHGYAIEVGRQAIYKTAQRIAWGIPAEDPDSQYVVVFNPHAWDANLNVEYDLEWQAQGAPKELGGKPNVVSILEDEKGEQLPHQWTQGSAIVGHRGKLVFRAPVPAFGYRQFRVRPASQSNPSYGMLRVSEHELENSHIRIKFAPEGSVSVYDKDNQCELFREATLGARAVVLKDTSDTWSHDVKEYSDAIGSFGNASFKVLESGPLRGVVRTRSSYGDSKLQIDWVLYADSRNLEARVELDWHEHEKMLKFSFPVSVTAPVPTYEIAYGAITREATGMEDPGQRWIDVTGESAGRAYGLAVINDAKYGYSVRGNDLRISICRGSVYALHRPGVVKPGTEYVWQDQGIQTFRMLLVPHAGPWQEAGLDRRAEEFTAPVPVIYQGIHSGARPKAASFLSIDSPAIVVSAVKQAEDGNDLIVRGYETQGRPAKVTLRLDLVQKQWTGGFHPFEIKTLRVPRSAGSIREVNILEE